MTGLYWLPQPYRAPGLAGTVAFAVPDAAVAIRAHDWLSWWFSPQAHAPTETLQRLPE